MGRQPTADETASSSAIPWHYAAVHVGAAECVWRLFGDRSNNVCDFADLGMVYERGGRWFYMLG